MIQILSLIGGLLALAGKIFEFLYAQKLVDAGKTSQQLEDLKGRINAAQEAIALREKARAAAELNPSGVMQPDDFTRPES